MLRLKSVLAAAEVMTAGRRVLELLSKANFDPNQPRVPGGNPDGGQWTGEGWHSTQQVAAIIPLRVLRRLIGRDPPPEVPQDKPSRMSLT